MRLAYRAALFRWLPMITPLSRMQQSGGAGTGNAAGLALGARIWNIHLCWLSLCAHS